MLGGAPPKNVTVILGLPARFATQFRGAIVLKQPVPIAAKGQAITWELGEEDLSRIEAQMPENRAPIVHDLSVLG